MSLPFVVVIDGRVTGKIMADSFEAAEIHSGVGNIVIETEETGPADVWGTWDGQKFYPRTEEIPTVAILSEETIVE